MKKILSLMAVAGFLAACHTTKHIEKTTTKIDVDSSFVAAHNEVKTKIVADTSTTETGAITITEIEFFDRANLAGDSVDHSANDSGVSAIFSLDPSGILSFGGKIGGNIKGIKQTRIEKAKQTNGRSEKEETSVQDDQAANVKHNEQTSEVRKEITKEIFPAKYYLITIASVVAVLLILWKRRYISTWFRKFLSNLTKIG